MTLAQRYQDLTISLTMFGKTYPAPLKELTINELKAYSARLIASNVPMLKSVGFEINRNMCFSGYSINGNIS